MSTWKYNKGKHSCEEQPTMQEPIINNAILQNLSVSATKVAIEILNEYDTHIASLRSISVPKEIIVDWKDGEDVTSKFEITVTHITITQGMPPKVTLAAIPIKQEHDFDKSPGKMHEDGSFTYKNPPRTDIPPIKQEQPQRQSISETFKQLRELSGGYWDTVKCICEELGRGKCELNCKEHSENQSQEQPKQVAIESEDEIIDELYAYLKPGEDITCKNSPITTKHLREMFVITRRK